MLIVPISVIIPAYNSERFIREAIESVQNQTVGVSEIIVVDNNCTDRTRQIAEEMGAVVIEQQIQNLAATRNKGISACKNDWIALLDSDDLWEKEKIEYQWQALEAFPKARIISCDSGHIIEKDGGARLPSRKVSKPTDNIQTETTIGDIFSYCGKLNGELINWFWLDASTSIFHREVFSSVGLFDESLYWAEELDFFLRALAQFPIVTVKKDLVYLRRHEANMTNDQDSMVHYSTIVTEQMLKFPDKYPPGAGDYYVEALKWMFVLKAREISSQRKRPSK